MTRLLLIQGANLVWLGKREPEIYGRTSAAELDAMLGEEARRRSVTLDIRYTNLEGEAIDWIYEARGIKSATGEAARGVIQGFGLDGYFVGLDAMLRLLAKKDKPLA